MKTVDFEKVKAGDLVEVPRTQFAPMRRGWNGWLFSEAVVIQKGISAKNRRKVIKVENADTEKQAMTTEQWKDILCGVCISNKAHRNGKDASCQADGVNSKEEFYEYIKQDDVCGWRLDQKFLVDKDFYFKAEKNRNGAAVPVLQRSATLRLMKASQQPEYRHCGKWQRTRHARERADGQQVFSSF